MSAIKKFENFAKSQVYQKHLSSKEKKQYREFVKNLSTKPDDNKEELVKKADELLAVCNEAIKKIRG